MNRDLHSLFLQWKHPVITSSDLAVAFNDDSNRRYSMVKRLLDKKILIQLKRGIYVIGTPYNQTSPEPFALAPLLYGPSYVSFESALSHHGWIPEAVYATTSATTKRRKDFRSDIGRFTFKHTPSPNFYLGVQRIVEGRDSYFLADPWKAVADLSYHSHKTWPSAAALSEDLRIEIDDMRTSDLNLLKALTEHYAAKRVRQALKTLWRELT